MAPEIVDGGGIEMAAGGALAGLRVLDLSRVLAGPYCGQMLGDHGAEVIKVESPSGDETRAWGPPYHPDGKSAYFTGINRNKANLCLDLSSAEGQRVLWRLLDRTDVVIENFKAGTMSRWGLDYETVLAERFPSLIYCRITGFGTTGPLGGLPGYDAVLQAYSGLMSVNGEADQDPVRIGVPVVDLVTGMLSFSGILLALNERSRSGLGQLVDCALLDSALSVLHPHASAWLIDGQEPPRTGSAHLTIAPYDTFRTRGGDLFFVAAASDRQFAGLVNVLGRPELAVDRRFLSNSDRVNNVAGLRTVLSGLITEWEPEALGRDLLAAGVPASPVNDVGQALSSPQIAHRDMLVSIGRYRGLGIPIKLKRSPGAVRSAPGDKGADSRSVLLQAGYDPQEITRLIASGTVREAASGAAVERSAQRR
jgi:crotonobetainyl-CoA:carnitine CoA-transferase CaiB-like acyl-CoA transferase